MGAVGTRETEVNVDFQIEIVPADGISGFWKSGEFGTSPFWAAPRTSLCLPVFVT
jgi:hypothetical protein